MDTSVYDNEITYWEQRLGDDVALNTVGYHGLSDAYVSWLYKVRQRRFLGIAKPLVTHDMRVLDIGSGGGFYLDLWRRLGAHDLTATDLTQSSLRAIRKRFPGVETAQLDIGANDVTFPGATFDAISCMDVLHHLMDDAAYERALKNCAQMLKPRGALIFTDNFLHGAAYRGPHHVSRPLIQIERFARDAGLRIETRKPMFVLMNNPVDSKNRFFKFYWRGMNFISENAKIGAITGAALYPFEIMLTSLLKEGPSTEICVARKGA